MKGTLFCQKKGWERSKIRRGGSSYVIKDCTDSWSERCLNFRKGGDQKETSMDREKDSTAKRMDALGNAKGKPHAAIGGEI